MRQVTLLAWDAIGRSRCRTPLVSHLGDTNLSHLSLSRVMVPPEAAAFLSLDQSSDYYEQALRSLLAQPVPVIELVCSNRAAKVEKVSRAEGRCWALIRSGADAGRPLIWCRE